MKKISNSKQMKIVIIIAILIIPILYSFFYLKAFWDPYGNLKQMKIGIVNLDEGADNKNLGKELLEKLQGKDVMNIQEVSKKDANTSLTNQEYYALLTIPKDFTKTLNNSGSKDRQIVTITYSPNQKSSYLASQIIKNVVTSTQTELTGTVNQEIVGTLSNKLEEVPNQMNQISDGAGQIQDGSSSLKNGLETLSDGTSQLNNKYSEFDKGVKSAYEGSTSLDSGVSSLSNGIDQVNTGAKQLAEGTKSISKLKEGIASLQTGSTKVANGAESYVAGVETLLKTVSKVNETATKLGKDFLTYKNEMTSIQTELTEEITSLAKSGDPTKMQVAGELQTILKKLPSTKAIESDFASLQAIQSKSGSTNELINGGKTLTSGANQLKEGINTMANSAQKLNSLSEGTEKLASATGQLTNGANQLKAGSTSLKQGMKTLSSSSAQVKNGISSLNTGAKTATEGSQSLETGVTTFKNSIDNGIKDVKAEIVNLDGLDTYAKAPIKIDEQDYGKIDKYGIGFAPYFMSISLWVGLLMAFVVFYYDPENRFKLLGRFAENKYLRAGLYALVAIAQGIILGFLLKAGLGFTVTNTALYYVSCILVSLVFLSILQCLIINLGDVGKFLAIVLLVLQLASSAGTFPIETTPAFFQKLYPFMPMNYSIKLFKESIVSIDTGFATKYALILIGIAAVFFAITIIADYIRNKKKKLAKNT